MQVLSNDSDRIVMLLQIPKNETTKLQTKELKSWAYWIGAGKESEEAFAENEENFKQRNHLSKIHLQDMQQDKSMK